MAEDIKTVEEEPKSPCENCGGMGVKQDFKKLPDPSKISRSPIVKFVKQPNPGLGVANFTSPCRACGGSGKVAG